MTKLKEHLFYVVNLFAIFYKMMVYFFKYFKFDKVNRRTLINQLYKTGNETVPILSMVGFFIGLILAMQSAYQLQKYGQSALVAGLVGVTLTRELGPLMCAIIVAGRIGSSYASEIASMKLNEEIDALSVMSISPVDFIIIPRFIALMIMVPVLTVLTDAAGIIGGMVIGVFTLDMTPAAYITNTFDIVTMKDLFIGIIKSVAFAFFICLIGCYEGFKAKKTSESVGKATTDSVVISIFVIIVVDCLFTALFYF